MGLLIEEIRSKSYANKIMHIMMTVLEFACIFVETISFNFRCGGILSLTPEVRHLGFKMAPIISLSLTQSVFQLS